MNSGLLPVLFPFDRVVMQKQRPMILLDGFEAGRSRVLEVILNEFQMNCRHDALGTRLWRGGFHNKLDSFAVIKRSGTGVPPVRTMQQTHGRDARATTGA
jgi:hypothetical protein